MNTRSLRAEQAMRIQRGTLHVLSQLPMPVGKSSASTPDVQSHVQKIRAEVQCKVSEQIAGPVSII